jgi:hypothetical protein
MSQVSDCSLMSKIMHAAEKNIQHSRDHILVLLAPWSVLQPTSKLDDFIILLLCCHGFRLALCPYTAYKNAYKQLVCVYKRVVLKPVLSHCCALRPVQNVGDSDRF